MNQISLRKLLDLESEQYAIDLNIRLAAAAGIENENVEIARSQLELVCRQISVLTAWILPAPADDTDDADTVDESANGQKPELAETR